MTTTEELGFRVGRRIATDEEKEEFARRVRQGLLRLTKLQETIVDHVLDEMKQDNVLDLDEPSNQAKLLAAALHNPSAVVGTEVRMTLKRPIREEKKS